APWLVRDPAARQTTLRVLNAAPAHALARLGALAAPRPRAAPSPDTLSAPVPARTDSRLTWFARLYDAALVFAFAAAFAVMVVRRRHEGQRGPGRWLLPYAASLYPLLAALLIPAAFVSLAGMDAVRPFVCLGAGWLAAVLWQRLAERRRTLVPRRR
ncbi:hypothetical protein MTR62_10580, partial [Novosphingobium sp. 1949]|nr:hypothetical protein [Novosphingobium organovorum]